MNMHKNTRLTPRHRQAIWTAYTQEKESVTSLARRYMVSRPPSTAYSKPPAAGCWCRKTAPTTASNRRITECTV